MPIEKVIHTVDDMLGIVPKYMKLPIQGFRNKNFHCFVTTDHFLELLNRQGMINSFMSAMLMRKIVMYNLIDHGVYNLASENLSDNIFMESMIHQSKVIFTIVLPRLNYLFSVHFFGVQPVFDGRGLTEYRENKVNSFSNQVHRILSPYEYIMFNHPVHAVADGKVVSIENSYEDRLHQMFEVNFGSIKPDDYLGNTIEIEHSPLCHSVYGNLKKNSMTVRPGQSVSKGDIIARVGMSGKHPSPYLFFALATPGVKVPIGGNIRVGLHAAHGVWDTHFEYDLFKLSTPLTDEHRTEDFYNYIRTDNIKYTFAPSKLRDGVLVKQYPTIQVE